MSDKRGWRKRGKTKKGAADDVTSSRLQEVSRTLEDIDEVKVTSCNGEVPPSSYNIRPEVISVAQMQKPPPLPLPVTQPNLYPPTTPTSPRSPTSPTAPPQLPKLNPPPGVTRQSRSYAPPASLSHDPQRPFTSSQSSFTVTADIESPPGRNNAKSWPGSPVHDKVNNSGGHVNDAGHTNGNVNNAGNTATKLNIEKQEGSGTTVTKIQNTQKGPLEGKVNNTYNSPHYSLGVASGTMPAAVTKLNRTPSLSKSKSDEALAGNRIKPSSRKQDKREEDALSMSFDSANKGTSPFAKTPPENKLGRSSGKDSPGSESTASLMSQATVITHTGGALDSPHARGSQKHTLGEILKHIDLKSASLLEREDYTGATTLPDLTFLAHQSRYNADPQIKRRLMSRLADCHVVQIFLRVLKSVCSVDYLQCLEAAGGGVGDGGKVNQGSQPGAGLPPHSPRGQADSPRGPRRPLDMMSEPGVDARSMLSERLHNVPHSMKNLRAALTLLVNCTDKSTAVCEQCTQSHLVSVLLEQLSQPHFHGTDAMRDQNRMYLVKGYLGILLNVIKHQPDARDLYREAAVVQVLQQYLKSSLLMVKTRALLLLSYVIGEAENEVINSTDRHLGLVLKMLQGALESDTHFSKKYGLSAAELASAINRYASCESNKVRLLRRGALPLYTQLLGGNEEEQMLGAKGLWSLAFSEENRAAIQQDTGCLQGLQSLEKTSQREEIRKTASGALWVIQEHHIPVRPVGSEYWDDPDLSQHVLISYQWGAKTLVFKIKERLKAAGYKVCTDVENTAVPIMDGMAGAVSRAAVVLLCLTHRFKESPSCRTEAEYSWHGGRGLIPLKLQPHYSPEGWLTPLVDGRLTLDLSSDDNLDTLLPNLIREIGNRGRARVIEQFDLLLGGSSSSLPKPQDVATQTVSLRDTTAGWSCDDVHRWLKSQDLGQVADKLKNVNGELLLEIKKMQKDAPESFYTTLKSDLKLNFLTVLKFTRVLDKL